MATFLPIGWERSRSSVPRLPQGRVTWAHELTQARPDQGLSGSGIPQQQGRPRPAHPVGVSRTQEPLRPPQGRRHHRVHGLGAHQVARVRRGVGAQGEERQGPGAGADGAQDVRVLRSRPRARDPPHHVVEGARPRGAPLRRVHRRRPRNHGGRQPRRGRGEGPERGAHHLHPGGGIRQPLRHARALLPLPLLLHAQVLVRVPGQGGHRVSGRLRNARRAVRAADAGADAQDAQAHADRALRHRVLARSHRLRRARAPRHHRPRRHRAPAPYRLGGRRLRLDRLAARREGARAARGDVVATRMSSAVPDLFAFMGAGWVRPIILAALLGGLWIGLRRTQLSRREQLITWLGIAVPLLAWLFVVLQLAQAGIFRPGAVAPLPALPLAVILPVLLALLLLVRSKNIAAAIDAVPASWLIGLQVYRVLGAVFLVRWAAGTLPAAFALPAGAGDVLVGLLALPVAFFVHSRARGSWAAGYAWNVLGILDLALALAMGFLTTPGPFQLFASDR